MDEQLVRRRVQEFIDALHGLEQGEDGDEGTLEPLAGLFADDARLTNAALRLAGGERAGRSEIRAFWDEYRRSVGRAYSDFLQVTVGGAAAGLFWTTRATDTNGREGAAVYDGATLLLFDDSGRIREFRAYYDTLQFDRAIGVRTAAAR